jgi:hypothetical protein
VTEPRRARGDTLAVVLLSLAAVSTAWSSYQANRWNGEQAKAGAGSNKARIEAARASTLANAQTTVDVATFTEWINAYAREDTQLTSFYRTRFRPEFKPAFAAWIATHPLTTRGAPLTPFAMPAYRLAATDEAARLDAKADGFAASARADIQRSSNYVLAVVIFAVALFFAGISTKLATRRLQAAMLVLACVVFVGAVAWVLTLPVSLSI